MNPSPKSAQELILETITAKSTLKQRVFENTFETFNLIKGCLQEISQELNAKLRHTDRRIKLEYRDRGRFECELRVASDILIFSMHTNVFQFDRDHSIWKLSYVQSNNQNTYCGMINIYNFLTDSFKYNRVDDLGYLVGRLFVNTEKHYFVEGKRQMGFLYNNFGQSIVSRNDMRRVIQTAMLYSLEFDLLAPPYDVMKIATVAQLNTKIASSNMQTGKRLGFKFNSDDVLEEK